MGHATKCKKASAKEKKKDTQKEGSRNGPDMLSSVRNISNALVSHVHVKKKPNNQISKTDHPCSYLVCRQRYQNTKKQYDEQFLYELKMQEAMQPSAYDAMRFHR